MPDDFALGYDKQPPSDSTLFENGSSERSQHSQEAPQLDGSGSLGLETRLSNRGTCQMDDEGDEAELTELAMPLPVEPDSPGRDHLEQAQLEVRRRKAESGTLRDDNEFLTEVEMPSIADRNARSTEEGAGVRTRPRPEILDEKDSSLAEGRRLSSLATELYTICHLVFFSLLGTLSRLGIEAITCYPQAPVISPALWANVGGSFIFGFLSEDRQLFKQEWGTESEDWSFRDLRGNSHNENLLHKAADKHSKAKKTIPMFIGLTTGFCGSFTSFSSFLRDAFLALSSQLVDFSNGVQQKHRNPGYGFEAATAVLVVHVACSISALEVGAHMALFTGRFVPTIPFRFIRRLLDPLAVILGGGCWIGAVILAIWPPKDYWRDRAVLSLVFAPPGCLMRFYVSKHLNGRIPAFPLGTFCVNMFGTAILGMCFDLQRAGNGVVSPNGNMLACQILEGVMEGFCGCATTVSTWVAELKTLERKHAYLYGVSSLAAALALLVTIVGTLLWTKGFQPVSCMI
jgi:CrcB protein